MISGKEIKKQVANGNITIEPYNDHDTGPNSHDLRLSHLLAKVCGNAEMDGIEYIDTRRKGAVVYQKMNLDGSYTLLPGVLYLGHTMETIGSNKYGSVLHGRSSCARHGLMVHFAGFIDIGFFGQIVLEIVNHSGYPMIVYPGDRVCQVEFTKLDGNADLYDSTYQNQTGIVPGKSLAD